MKAKIGFFYIVLCGFIFAYISIPTVMSKYYFFCVICIIVLCLIIFLIPQEKNIVLKNRVLKHSNLLILSIMIVNFQYPLDYILNYSLPSDTFIWLNEASASKSLILSSIGLLCMLIGYLLFSSIAKKSYGRNLSEKIHGIFSLKAFALISLLFYFYTVNPLYLLGGYASGIEMGSAAKYAALLFNSIVIAIIIQSSRNLINKSQEFRSKGIIRYLKEIGFFTLSLIGIYLLSVVFSGDRGPVLSMTLAILGGYLNVSKERFKLITVFLFILVASFLFNLLGIARSFDPELSFKEKIEIAYTADDTDIKKSISPTTQELAGSIKTLHYVVDYVPEKHNYTLGRFQFYELISAVPLASGLYFKSWSEQDLNRYASIANFITWIVQGDNPTYGNGASLIADFYVAGGLLGIIVGMLLTGFLVRKSEYVMYSDSLAPLFWHVFSIVYFSNMIYLGRSSLFEGLKMVVMVLIVIYINRLFSLKKIYIK